MTQPNTTPIKDIEDYLCYEPCCESIVNEFKAFIDNKIEEAYRNGYKARID